jgi:hypothetical protein
MHFVLSGLLRAGPAPTGRSGSGENRETVDWELSVASPSLPSDIWIVKEKIKRLDYFNQHRSFID